MQQTPQKTRFGFTRRKQKIKKKCPECGGKAVKLYQNKTIEGKRRWVPVAWRCTECHHTYNVVADTLMYKIGHEPYKEEIGKKCPKCDKHLVRVYRHINPKHGKQKWVSLAWYCERCRYIWTDKKEQ
ncbi:MAG: hypothetical protein V5A64_02510 [Candidatus Thermoplasmatota archaeon]